VNFNTIYAVRKDNRVRSAEKQTPITPLSASPGAGPQRPRPHQPDPGPRGEPAVRYADTSRHGRVRFVISLGSNNGGMRFRLLRAIESGL
jgi:hypothetical protein